jgi:hypothetical protein
LKGEFAMQENIRQIDFVLENCEIISIDGQYIGDLNIENITTTIARIARNSIKEMDICEHFSISLNHAANILIESKLDGKINVFNRLFGWYDITEIDILWDDDTTSIIYVPWSREYDCENMYQTSDVNGDGDLFIVIDKNKTTSDVEFTFLKKD